MEDLKIFVGSRTDHRIDVMLADLFSSALHLCGINYTNVLDDEFNLAIVFNGIEKDGDIVLNTLLARNIPTVYMADDVDIPLPKHSNILLVSQFSGYNIQFPIAELLVFHKLWDTNLDKDIVHISFYDGTLKASNRKYKNFYGGTFKDRRDYTPLYELPKLLIVGDDDRWKEVNKNAEILPTIRDMDELYKVMSTCESTHIVYDEEHYGRGNTLRLYEAAMCGLRCFIWDKNYFADCVYTPKEIKNLVNKENVLLKVKGLLWTIQQQM